MNQTKKSIVVKKPRLSEQLGKALKKRKKTVSYGKLAEQFGTNPRAVGQAVKALSKTFPALAKLVVYDPNTRPKTYKSKTK